MSQTQIPSLVTHTLGFPRIGEKRELKKATEAYWRGDLPAEDLRTAGSNLRRGNWLRQRDAGIQWIPCNDFSFYDQMLDMSCLLGNVPPRFGWDGSAIGLDLPFEIARGRTGGDGAVAAEMTKWFDTNYHYLVPEFRADTGFHLASDKVFNEFHEAKELGIDPKPVLIGPLTYLALGKVQDPENPDFDRFSLLERLLPVYASILEKLAAQGAQCVQIDEPALALDLPERVRDLYGVAYTRLSEAAPKVNLVLATYFGDLHENLDTALSLPVQTLHIDATRAPQTLENTVARLPDDKILSLGIVDGRNIWKNDYDASLETIGRAVSALGRDRVWLAPSCSLLHVPVSLRLENRLDDELKNWLAFAEEKLDETSELAALASGNDYADCLERNRAAVRSRRENRRIHRPDVKERAAAITPEDTRRPAPFSERRKAQSAHLKLPLFPTTTIGSFPQTQEVRSMRARWRKGDIGDAEYESFVERQIEKCVKVQEELRIDMPVHGEFERNDMVEYFGEQLEGFAFTRFGWVQSYGSRCVKPPVIYGDVSRPAPMTVRWSRYAQSLTEKPMKGMLTGPVTILQWSFVRNDQSREATARQIALAIRDEVRDLEAAGIAAIQIDEPAIREGLPLRQKDRNDYLRWAVESFRLCGSGVADETQIHTHMCYSEFNDMIQAIADLDADVITIETSRSNMELLDAFVDFRYPAEIGPGVYDIHSPRVPSVEEMEKLIHKATDILPAENLWVNPDCGLKTRGWEEVVPALKNLVTAARRLREEIGSSKPAHSK